MSYEIVPCQLSHLCRLVATLRGADRAELEATGRKPRHVLFELWRRSVFPRAALIDGEVAAAWGDAADMLSPDGWPWLFTAPPIERLPLAFMREARRQIAQMLQGRTQLLVDTHCGYKKALRFWRLLKFDVAPPDRKGWCRMTIGR